mmetsp:Transcript_101902/g.283542  ORF Transcript_101902/g.283542 Transcript_101902/m.283542 type:complete len:213 (+) Transcript_101902:544-1182(+)
MLQRDGRPGADVARVHRVVLEVRRREGLDAVRARPCRCGCTGRRWCSGVELRELREVLMVWALAQQRERQPRGREHLLHAPLAGVVDRRLDLKGLGPLAQRSGAVDHLGQAGQPTCGLGEGGPLLQLVPAAVPVHGPAARGGAVQRCAQVRRIRALQCPTEAGYIGGVAGDKLHARRQGGERTSLLGAGVPHQRTDDRARVGCPQCQLAHHR